MLPTTNGKRCTTCGYPKSLHDVPELVTPTVQREAAARIGLVNGGIEAHQPCKTFAPPEEKRRIDFFQLAAEEAGAKAAN